MTEHPSRPVFLAPPYYPRFRCIADRCRHSCCIDWEICIDERTLARYRTMADIIETVTEDEDGASFVLAANGRCPHLDACGLCRIIRTYGEDCLSDICRRHPRFFNDMGGGRMEVGLGLVCEEACRLILEDASPFSLMEILDLRDGNIPPAEPDEDTARAFDSLPLRDAVMAEIERTGRDTDHTFAAIRATFGIPAPYTQEAWLDRFLSLEMLDEAWAETLRAAKGKNACVSAAGLDAYDGYFARLLRYFVYRHVSVASDSEDFRARLGFALLSVETIRYLFACEPEPTLAVLADLARRYSAEIEYSEDNTDELIFAFACAL